LDYSNTLHNQLWFLLFEFEQQCVTCSFSCSTYLRLLV